ERNAHMHPLGELLPDDACKIEREHEQIAACRHQAAAEHHDPVDRLLAGIEQVCRRMLLAEAATLLEPFKVYKTWQVPADPHQEDHHHAEREGEAEIVV